MNITQRRSAIAAVLPALILVPALAGSATGSPLSSLSSSIPGGVADDPSVVINEVESNGDPEGDWVELANTDPNNSVDVSGWEIIDDDPTHDPIVLPADTGIESGGYLVVHTEENFGLGGNDSVTLSEPDGSVADTTTWSGHAATTWGRVPDMTGEFTVTGEPTKGLRNIAADESGAGPATDNWPYDPQQIEPVTLTGEYADDFGDEDMSGVDFGPDGTAYVVNNDEGVLYVLSPQDGNSYHVDSRHQLRYPDGTGLPDAEGVTVGEDGALFVATERDNTDGRKDNSRPSVMRYELGSGDELTATDEWNLAEYTGDIGANGGLETIAWIHDSLFAVGVEETGDVLFVTLDDAAPSLVQRYDSPLEGVMASDYDATTGELTILCDEICGGASQVLVEGQDGFTPKDDSIHARPEGMDNLANEGFARFTDADGTERFLWADDGVTDGVGLRGAVA